MVPPPDLEVTVFWSLCISSALASPTAFVGATVYPVSGPVIEDGTLLVEDGRILAVGPRDSVTIAEGIETVDLAGKHVVPGLVDTHSHVAAIGDLNDSAGPLLPNLSAIDAVDATHVSIQRAQAGGVTAANIMPGSGNLMGGQTAYVKMRDALTIDEMLFCDDRYEDVCGGMKMANGTNPQRSAGSYPSTRMRAARLQRDLFDEAEKRRKASGTPESSGKRKKDAPAAPQAPDPRLDPVVEILEGERIVHFHTHRLDDIVTALGMQEQYGFKLVLHHVTEARKAAPLIADSDAWVSLIVIDAPGGKEEAVELSLESASVLEQAGVPVSIHTDDPILDSRLFLRSGALAVRGGMSEDAALAALTLKGAEMMGLEDRIGSLEEGKDADFVVLSGAPFSIYTSVLETWIDGQRVFDRSDPTDRAYAVGGDAVMGGAQ